MDPPRATIRGHDNHKPERLQTETSLDINWYKRSEHVLCKTIAFSVQKHQIVAIASLAPLESNLTCRWYSFINVIYKVLPLRVLKGGFHYTLFEVQLRLCLTHQSLLTCHIFTHILQGCFPGDLRSCQHRSDSEANLYGYIWSISDNEKNKYQNKSAAVNQRVYISLYIVHMCISELCQQIIEIMFNQLHQWHFPTLAILKIIQTKDIQSYTLV